MAWLLLYLVSKRASRKRVQKGAGVMIVAFAFAIVAMGLLSFSSYAAAH